jgi:conjugal transfer pilus assembly protein TraB
LGILGIAAYVVPKASPSTAADDRSKQVDQLILDGDTRKLTLEGLAGQIDKLEKEYRELSATVLATENNTAAGIQAIQTKIAQTPPVATGTDSVARDEIAQLDKRVAGADSSPGASHGTPGSTPQIVSGPLTPAAVYDAPSSSAQSGSAATLAAGGAGVGQVASMGGGSGAAAPATMHYVTGKDDTGAVPAAVKGLEEYQIPAGSILSGTLVTGLDAPTADSARRDPIPILLRLKDLAILPNRFKADVRECFVLLSAFGDLSSERAYARGEQISCVANDGTTIEQRLEGFASDETGKNGIVGKVVSKQGAFIARALTVSLMQGVAQAFASANSNSPVSVGTTSTNQLALYKSDTEQGVSNGVGLGMEKVAEFYLKQAGDMFPVIEVSAGRQIDVILTQGVKMALPNQTPNE